MPLTNPAGPINLAQEYLRTTLANSARFQTWCGEANANDAAARIYHEALPPPAAGETHTLAELQTYRPFAIVSTQEDRGFVRQLMAISGSGFEFSDSGSLRVLLEQDVDPDIADDPAEIDRLFKNDLGVILNELCALAGQAGYLAFHTVEFHGPYRADEDEAQTQGDYLLAILTFQWRQGQ